MHALDQKDGYALLSVRVQPKSSRNDIIINSDNSIKIALTAPPVEGEANKALCQLVAKRLGLPKSAVTLVSGDKSREKKLRVEGLQSAEIWENLTQKKGK